MRTEIPTDTRTGQARAGSVERFVRPAAILFARRDSVYKSIEGCDVWDIDRDARGFAGGMPVVAHPPCRAWGRLTHFERPSEGEKELAPWSVAKVRECGGVLEHPASSRLWRVCGLPIGAARDSFGGFTLSVDQHWWGHRANKETWLYVCGLARMDVPQYPIRIDEGTHCIMCDRRGFSRNRWKATLPKREREETPKAFAEWLVELARLSRPNDKPRHGAKNQNV